MCFSATASFGASAVLGTLGVITVAKAKTKPQKFFGTIPLLFSIQQLTEGLLWVSLTLSLSLPWQCGRSGFHLLSGCWKKIKGEKR